MAHDLFCFDDAELPRTERECRRCGQRSPMRFAGLCDDCRSVLRATVAGEARAVEDAGYVPKVNVTPNAVALRDS